MLIKFKVKIKSKEKIKSLIRRFLKTTGATRFYVIGRTAKRGETNACHM